MSAVPVHCDLNPAPVEQFAPRGGVFLSPEPRTIPSWVEEGACSLSLRIRSWLNNAPEPPLARLRQGSPTNGLDGFPPEGGSVVTGESRRHHRRGDSVAACSSWVHERERVWKSDANGSEG